MNPHELIDDQLCIEIAKALGWEPVYGKWGEYTCFFYEPGARCPRMIPRWTDNIEEAYYLETELETEEERDLYIDTLLHIVDEEIPQDCNPFDWGSHDTLWKFVHATPRQRAEAFLTVKQKEKE